MQSVLGARVLYATDPSLDTRGSLLVTRRSPPLASRRMAHMSKTREAAIVALLFGAMAAATVAAGILGVLATFIIDDLGITRSQLGWVLSSFVVFAAVLSPLAGVIADRIGGKGSLIGLFATSAVGFAVFGIAPGLIVMFVAAAITAMAQASANPATNTVISETFERGRRGVITGIKQSGVQAGFTLAGLTLPALAITFGWRTAMLIVAAGVLVGGVVAVFLAPTADRPSSSTVGERGRLPSSTWWIAAYGAVFGFAGSATFFVPLFAEEALGLDPRVAGAAVALAGIVALVSRIAWARHAEVHHSFRRPLGTMAALGVVAGILMLSSAAVPALLWIGAILTGMSTSAWNSVGMLAVIEEAREATGRASGIVQLGFLAGLGVGPTMFGALVDTFDSYTPMWLLSILTALASVGIVVAWSRAAHR